MLVTSRAPLRIRAEQEIRVAPLDEQAAVELFLERLASAGVTVESGPEVADLCRHLDGLPLALELAASAAVALGPSSLRDHLHTALGDGPRDLPERQRSMLATLTWSLDLVGPEERAPPGAALGGPRGLLARRGRGGRRRYGARAAPPARRALARVPVRRRARHRAVPAARARSTARRGSAGRGRARGGAHRDDRPRATAGAKRLRRRDRAGRRLGTGPVRGRRRADPSGVPTDWSPWAATTRPRSSPGGCGCSSPTAGTVARGSRGSPPGRTREMSDEAQIQSGRRAKRPGLPGGRHHRTTPPR